MNAIEEVKTDRPLKTSSEVTGVDSAAKEGASRTRALSHRSVSMPVASSYGCSTVHGSSKFFLHIFLEAIQVERMARLRGGPRQDVVEFYGYGHGGCECCPANRLSDTQL